MEERAMAAEAEEVPEERSADDPPVRASTMLEPPPPVFETGVASTGSGQENCPSCAAAAGVSSTSSPVHVFALGRIEPRFPTLGVEKEFAQATGRTDAYGLTDRETLQAVFAEPKNRYLARQLCWVFTVQGLDTYLLRTRDPADLSMLIESLRPSPDASDVDVVIGRRGPISAPEFCNGLMVPVVLFDQVYSFDRESLIDSLPVPEEAAADQYRSTARELFDRTIQLSDNAGATDEHRALNYLAVRYPSVYTRTAEAFANNQSLSCVEVRPSPLSGTRTIMDVVFSYTGRETDVTEKYFARVDVSEMFPFLVSRFQPYYDR
ncbi:hypothetical protein [Streptomyces virginiae]|uniref:cyanobactin maturation protease PatG family protein n=1 Tax=Streptomyces virginiae TaxID=1961 RepID=UPI00224E8559|nr:hypothetical protein [Streptomyces virginiae]MCX4961254.1 hypothetical protein [Streptomyces virginiae]